ncbi:hypothetical protein V8G54_035833 [Vigna mungo]|uniref:Uncharacterized protein n=1 Tax=Vigna mungo TaxID=3915 RepID=A0AAQ3MG09_VIGMU
MACNIDAVVDGCLCLWRPVSDATSLLPFVAKSIHYLDRSNLPFSISLPDYIVLIEIHSELVVWMQNVNRHSKFIESIDNFQMLVNVLANIQNTFRCSSSSLSL